MTDIMEVLKQKFSSGNDIPVTSSRISLEEYQQIVALFTQMQDEIESIKEYQWMYQQLCD